MGNLGESDDNPLGETINGLHKAELVHRRAPWKTKEALELATPEWVSWFNHHRQLSSIKKNQMLTEFDQSGDQCRLLTGERCRTWLVVTGKY
jgi:transposase InsO family protein